MELITVAAIVAVLSAISYPVYKGYHQRARVYEAKRELGGIVTMADVFRANAGFYLPNLREMHVPIKGRHSYNYKVLCHDKTGGDVEWGGNDVQADTCGDFDYAAYGDPSPNTTPVENTLDASSCTSGSNSNAGGDNKCWMGYVLCHSSPPNDQNLPAGSETFPCSTGAADSYQNKGSYYPGVIQFKLAGDEDWNDNDKVLGTSCTGSNKGLACYFNIVDFASESFTGSNAPLCKRAGRQTDVLTDASHCFHVQEFALKSGDVKDVITGTSEWTNDQESFISNPFKLTVIALACKDRQDDCGKNDAPHSIIRIDTNRMVKEIQ